MDKDHLRIMISSPMKGRTQEEIDAERAQVVDDLMNHPDFERNCVFMSTVIEDADKKSELECFSESIWHLSQADILCMAGKWASARGCRLEHAIAEAYHVPIIYYDEINHCLEGDFSGSTE